MINKIDNTLPKQIEGKRERTQISNIISKRGHHYISHGHEDDNIRIL